MKESPKIGGPYNKDPTILGTILGSPTFGNSHEVLTQPKGSKYHYGIHL